MNLKAAVVWLFLAFERVLTAQTPLSSHAPLSFYTGVENDLGQWDLGQAPAVNATGHLVFDTANNLLQHWANTHYRIGHTIVPGTIPVGTLLYHGSITGPHLPTTLDWVSVEPDHSMIFCNGSIETGCWHLTLSVTRSMKVLYFDGNSAAKISEGTMDAQDLVAWSKMKPEWMRNEEKRIADLCKWGQKYGLNGFVRMEINFEVMICNFTSHMEVVSFLNLESTRFKYNPPTDLPGDPTTAYQLFEIMHSASLREIYPGETRIILDFSGLISFYDTALVPSLVPRRAGLERWDHRVKGISSEDIERVQERLAQVLVRPSVTTSIDWKTVLRVVIDRYSSRLEMIQYLLNMMLDDRSIFNHAQQVQRRLHTVLLPYILFVVTPSNISVTADATNSWAVPVFRECAMSHTTSIVAHGTTLTPSERLLLQAVQETTREICRVTTKMWASGLIAGVDPFYPPEERPDADHMHTLMGEWKEDMTQLISWLDWSVWVKCRPACGIEEMCYLSTLPFARFPINKDHDPLLQAQWDGVSLWTDEEWKRPKPKCIRRVEPYGF